MLREYDLKPSTKPTQLPLGTLIHEAATDKNPYQIWEINSVLGEGNWSYVYKVLEKQSRQTFAMKVIQKNLLNRPKFNTYLMREISMNSTLKHRNICAMERCFQDQSNYYMLLEPCWHGNLQ
jgi:serine/threonine protein kinase